MFLSYHIKIVLPCCKIFQKSQDWNSIYYLFYIQRNTSCCCKIFQKSQDWNLTILFFHRLHTARCKIFQKSQDWNFSHYCYTNFSLQFCCKIFQKSQDWNSVAIKSFLPIFPMLQNFPEKSGLKQNSAIPLLFCIFCCKIFQKSQDWNPFLITMAFHIFKLRCKIFQKSQDWNLLSWIFH